MADQYPLECQNHISVVDFLSILTHIQGQWMKGFCVKDGLSLAMSEPLPSISRMPDAGPSSLPPTRSTSPAPDGSRTLQRNTSHGSLAKLMVPGISRRSSSASELKLAADQIHASPFDGRSTPEQRRRTGKSELKQKGPKLKCSCKEFLTRHRRQV